MARGAEVIMQISWIQYAMDNQCMDDLASVTLILINMNGENKRNC